MTELPQQPRQQLSESRFDAIKRFKERLGTKVAELADSTPVNLFVMGPSLSESSPGSALRRELIKRSKEQGYSALAEHPEIKAAVTDSLGDDVDLCTVELNYAARVDLLIFIPCSPGSIAELGYFAALASHGNKRKPLGPKSILLVDAKFEHEASFLADGPIQLMREARAQVNYVDYEDIEFVWGLLRSAIAAERRRKVREEVTG